MGNTVGSGLDKRLDTVRTVARDSGVDAVALVPGPTLTKILGHDFHESERPFVLAVPADGPPAALVPNLELESFRPLGFAGEVFDWTDQAGYAAAFGALFAHLKIESLGVEGQAMRVFVDRAITAAAPAVRVVDCQSNIARLRLRKDTGEIAALREAIRISEAALAETLDTVRVGQTEAAIESVLVQRLFANGAKAMSFSPIVAAGDNSARPHASARADYALRPGDALLFDFGAAHDGLCADITRTVFVGHVDDRHRDVYDTVLAANRAGLAASRPGASAHDVDDAATTVLEASAHSNRIVHKTGHGLGRDVHEAPQIMRGNRTVLEPGMVFTVEPGLYGPGDFGVRIEDDVLVTDDGAESLTSFERELVILDPR